MSFFDWNERYVLGIDSIDSDHKVLVELINDLYSALSKGEGKEAIHSTVSKLVDYARVHFKREEYYMQSIQYSETKGHIQQHENFTKKVYGYVEKLDSGINNISIEVITFLRDWLINHILYTDKIFVEELKRHDVN